MTDTDPSSRAERSQPGAGALSGIRVLDVSGDLGAYCSKLLADLGADVLEVEPPGGDDLRRRPPFTGRSESLIFLSYHSNKRGITLDVGRAESLPALEALGRKSDVIVASPTRRRPVTGFDRDAPALAWAGPHAIVASITPFGLTGPMRDLRMTPFLSFAMGGGMHWVGQSDGPPLAVPGQLQWDEAGIHAAAGIVAALFARDREGGQLLDLSVHEVAAAKDFLLERYDVAPPDEWGRSVGVGYPPTGEWECRDGPLSVAAHQRYHWQAFLAMLDHPDELSDPAFEDPLFRREIFDALEVLIAPLMSTRSRLELFAKGQAAGLPCAPRYTPGQFVLDEQPQARETFAAVEEPRGGTATIPWRWCHSDPQLIGLHRRAPDLGEHNVDVYVEELGFDAAQLEKWKEAGIV
jgi:crotonobetainyl-CoA:carnitine CoA-transferase CaiB-like acyl-CoA transferase